MEFKELNGKKKQELVEMLHALKKESFNLRIQKSEGKLEKLVRLRECRRDYARVKTKLTSLKLA